MNFLMGGAKGGLTGGFGIGGMIRDVLSKINNPIMNSFNLPNISPMTSVQPRPEDFVEVFPDLQERPTIETYPDMQEPPMPEIYPDMQKVHTPEVFPDMQEPSEPETLPSGDDVMREAGIDIRPFHTMYIGASPEEQGAFDPLFDKGKTRKEISDKMANILPKEQWNETIPFSGGGKLKDILAHSELYNKYPELADMPVEMVLGSGTSPFVKSNLGSYDNGKINLSGDLYPYPDEIRNTLLHEIQHAIQGKEGWASGGSPTNTKPEMVEDDINALFDAANMRAYMEQNGVNVGQAKEWYRSNFGREPHKFAGQFARTETSDSISNLINEQKQRLSEAKDPYGHYLRLAGEIEARDTASRKNMNMEQRLSTSPYAGQGIPLKDVITRNFSNKSMSINQPQPQGEGIWKEPYNMTLEEFKNPQLPKANEGEVILYHRLRYPTDLDSVLKEGLKLSKKTKGGEGGSGNMWFSIEPSGYSKEGTIIGIKVPKSEVDLQHYGQGQAVMFRDIKPSEIVYVDKKGYSEVSTGRRLSEERSSDYAEEYYKAYSKLSQPQGEGITVYRAETGGSYAQPGAIEGKHFAGDREGAKEYGENITETVIKPKKMFVGNPTEYLAKKLGLKIPSEFGEKGSYEFSKVVNKDTIKKELLKEGYDSIKIPAGSKYFDFDEYIVLDESIIQSKLSQPKGEGIERQQEIYNLSMNNLGKKVPENYDNLVIPEIENALKNVKGDVIRNKVYNYIVYYYNKGQSEGILDSINIRKPNGETGKVYYKIGDGKIDVRLLGEGESAPKLSQPQGEGKVKLPSDILYHYEDYAKPDSEFGRAIMKLKESNDLSTLSPEERNALMTMLKDDVNPNGSISADIADAMDYDKSQARELRSYQKKVKTFLSKLSQPKGNK